MVFCLFVLFCCFEGQLVLRVRGGGFKHARDRGLIFNTIHAYKEPTFVKSRDGEPRLRGLRLCISRMLDVVFSWGVWQPGWAGGRDRTLPRWSLRREKPVKELLESSLATKERTRTAWEEG